MTYNPAKTTAELLDRMRAGLDWLRTIGLVEPMELVIACHAPRMATEPGTTETHAGRWQFCKYIARPGHPKPRNAKRGYTHPAKLLSYGAERETAGDATCPMPTLDDLRAVFYPLPVEITAEYYENHTDPFQYVIRQARLTRELLNSAT